MHTYMRMGLLLVAVVAVALGSSGETAALPGITERVSVDSAGSQGNGAAGWGSISADDLGGHVDSGTERCMATDILKDIPDDGGAVRSKVDCTTTVGLAASTPPFLGRLVLGNYWNGAYAEAEDETELDVGDESGESLTIEAWFYDPGQLRRAAIVIKDEAYELLAQRYLSGSHIVGCIGLALAPPSGQLWEVDHCEWPPYSWGWHHVAGVFYKGTGEMRIYLDGTAFSDLINFGTAINNSAKPLEVGFRFDGGLGGEVDELRISDFARYTGPTYAVPTAPFTCDEHTRALWHFDEFEGATVFHDACGVVDNLLVGYNGAHTERVPAGMLRVVTSPAVKSTVSANGIIRNDWGLDWTEVPAGQYTVSFSDVPGFITPDPQVVTVTEGATTVVTGVFSPVAYLRVTTVGWPPGETPTISVDGQPVNTWGLWVGLPPGSYTVSFEVIPGLTTPCSKVVTLTGGTTTHVEGNYSNGSCNIVP